MAAACFAQSYMPRYPESSLPREYVQVLTALVHCLATDPHTPLRTADEITTWLHGVSPQAVEEAIAGFSNHAIITRAVQCLLENTRHPLLFDWTPEQIADWCQRTRLQDVQAVLTAGSA